MTRPSLRQAMAAVGKAWATIKVRATKPASYIKEGRAKMPDGPVFCRGTHRAAKRRDQRQALRA